MEGDRGLKSPEKINVYLYYLMLKILTKSGNIFYTYFFMFIR
jgi:hypothetical protein